ncbi:MAG: TonB-dependent receptor, partial [Rhodospirillaceae bacterium]
MTLGEGKMKSRLLRSAALAAITVSPTLLFTIPALAAGPQIEEVIVTARKRQESILNVPVIETALPQQTLERLQVKDMKDIATLVPSLVIADNFLSIGTQISIRGVGTNAFDPGVDQSITLNIDGLSLANGLAFMSGSFDLGQVEVMKGPQALFYGKAAPGGVISLRSADPTDKTEVIGRMGYEFESREKRPELILSGPITDTIKGRLSGFYSEQDGFYHNIVTSVPAGVGSRVAPSRIAGQKNWQIRGTLLWNPTDDFDARLKINNVHDFLDDQGALQIAQCDEGVGSVFGVLQFLNPADNCKIDRNISWIEMDPKAFPFALKGGESFIETTQTYGTLELNYRPQSDITLTSTTAYYLLHSRSDFEASSASFFGPGIEALNRFRRREITEELRANSDFAGPLNFTAGGFIERGRVLDDVGVYGNTALGVPPELQKGYNRLDIETESLFGQARYKITSQVEVTAGGRWTHEKRSDTPFLEFSVLVPASAWGFQVKPKPSISSDNFAPEVTLSYKPTDDVTLFGSFKKASKSGSYHIGTPPDTSDSSFGEETVKGGEIGLKSRWLDHSLIVNLAGYLYNYSGLQVGAIVPVSGSVPLTTVINAGSAKVRGVEAEVVYRPPQAENLTLHTDIDYNHAYFANLDGVECYGGQTIAAGCNENLIGGAYTGQNDTGLPLVRSPSWAINFGADWEAPIGDDMKVIVANNQHFSSKYLTNIGKVYYQPSYIKADLSLTLQGPKDRWEISLIGKNVNDALTAGACTNFNGRGGLIVSNPPGLAAEGPAGHDQIGCLMDRGREL